MIISVLFNKSQLTPSKMVSAFHYSIKNSDAEGTNQFLTFDIRAAFESRTVP